VRTDDPSGIICGGRVIPAAPEGDRFFMVNYLMIYKSLTHAQKAAKLLERAGVASTIQKAPRGSAGEGCTYAVSVSERNLPPSLSVLRGAGMSPLKILSVYDDRYLEVPFV